MNQAIDAENIMKLNDVRLARKTRWKSFGIHAISPLYMSLASTAIAFVALIYPPNWFESALHEHDFVFMNVSMVIVILVSEVFFMLGIAFHAKVHSRGIILVRKSPILVPTKSLRKYGIFLSIFAITIEFVTAFTMISSVGLSKMVAAFTNQNAAFLLRENIVTLMRIDGFNILAFQILVFVAVLLGTFIAISKNGDTYQRRFSIFLAFAAGMSYILVNLMTFTRWQILQYFLSICIILVVYKNGIGGFNKKQIMRILLIFIGISATIFLAGNALKTHIHGSNALLGYTIGSYNVGAAVVSGKVNQPYANSSYGTLGFLWNAPKVGPYFRVFGRELGLDLPAENTNATIVWSSWTDALGNAGMNPIYQWDTVFGYIYGDVGFLFPFVFFLYGYISEYVFSGFVLLRPLSFLLYFPFAVSIVTWFSSVFISSTAIDDYFIFTAFIVFPIMHQWSRSVKRGRL